MKRRPQSPEIRLQASPKSRTLISTKDDEIEPHFSLLSSFSEPEKGVDFILVYTTAAAAEHITRAEEEPRRAMTEAEEAANNKCWLITTQSTNPKEEEAKAKDNNKSGEVPRGIGETMAMAGEILDAGKSRTAATLLLNCLSLGR